MKRAIRKNIGVCRKCPRFFEVSGHLWCELEFTRNWFGCKYHLTEKGFNDSRAPFGCGCLEVLTVLGLNGDGECK